jgi:hypothetical protein
MEKRKEVPKNRGYLVLLQPLKEFYTLCVDQLL